MSQKRKSISFSNHKLVEAHPQRDVLAARGSIAPFSLYFHLVQTAKISYNHYEYINVYFHMHYARPTLCIIERMQHDHPGSPNNR